MKLVPTAAVTFMMYAVTQPTILRRSLSLKHTAWCQTRVSPPQWRHGFNHILVAHWPGPDLPMAPVTVAQALETLRKKVDKTLKPSQNRKTCGWGMILFPKHLCQYPQRQMFQNIWFFTFKL